MKLELQSRKRSLFLNVGLIVFVLIAIIFYFLPFKKVDSTIHQVSYFNVFECINLEYQWILIVSLILFFLLVVLNILLIFLNKTTNKKLMFINLILLLVAIIFFILTFVFAFSFSTHIPK